MILHYTQLLADQNAPLLSVKTSSICLLQMGPQDSLQAVLHVLRHQTQPVLLLLPTSGDAFSLPEHFVSLRQLLLQGELPPFLCLIIAPERTHLVSLAVHFQIQSASTIEDALALLLSSTSPHQKEAIRRSHAGQKASTTDQMTKTQGSAEAPEVTLIPTEKNRPSLLSTGLFVLLLAASALLVPLMVFPFSNGTTTILPSMRSSGMSEQRNPDLIQSSNNRILVSLHALPAPPTGMFYYLWLIPNPGDEKTPPLLIDTCSVGGSINVTYTSPKQMDLLASYSGVRLTVQPSTPIPKTPSHNPVWWQWQWSFTTTPAHGGERPLLMAVGQGDAGREEPSNLPYALLPPLCYPSATGVTLVL